MKQDNELMAGMVTSRSSGKTEKKSQSTADTSAAVKDGLFSSDMKIWQSNLSWRVALAVFLTIMAVQASILALNIKSYEQQQLDKLKKMARTAIIPTIDYKIQGMLSMPFDEGELQRLISINTPISGLSVYSIDFDLLGYRGEPTTVFINSTEDINKTYYSDDGTSYEVIFRPRDLNSQPYYIVVKLDARNVTNSVRYHVIDTMKIMLFMSLLVTVVLMIALGKWLIEPILFLQNSLKNAANNPESPNVQTSPFSSTDEIGSAIHLAQDLIKQNAKNIHEIKNRAQDQIHKLAYFDSLTELPNRTSFLESLMEFKERAEGTPYTKNIRCAIMTLGLDHFKDINDSMGHNVGDAILKAVSMRLRSSLPQTVTVARMGADEFSIKMPLSGSVKTGKDAAEKVQALIRMAPFSVFNEDFQVRSSLGVSIFPDDGSEPEQILKNSDIALNRAKESGRDTFKEYMEDFDQEVQARFQMLRDLRDAIEHDQLTLNYQPQLNLKTGEVFGAEALLRWWKPDNSKEGGHWISPGEFIPVAEQSGLIVPIGEWVMRKACQTAKKWHDNGHMIRIAINVSGAQFQQSDLVKFTKSVLKETKIKPELVELEVTESAFMEDINHTIKILKELHALGVELAIDDFGTGYSSLSYLRQFPIDRLKIDQSFIRNALTDNDDASITRTIITLGHALNLKVIAEGVETVEHQKFLVEQGCDEVQGFRYSRAIPDDDFVEFIEAYSGKLDYFE